MQHQYGQYYTPKILTVKYDSLLKEKIDAGLRIVDPFVGEGNLLFDYLETIDKDKARQLIVDKKILGFDTDITAIKRVKDRFSKYFNLPIELFNDIFVKNNSLKNNRCKSDDFIFTNPPYLARNTCQKKFPKDFNRNFSKNSFNDYYEITLNLYCKNEGIWIIPSNFLSSKVMSKTRKKILSRFNICNAFLFEYPIFKDTRISVVSFSTTTSNSVQKNIKTTFVNKTSETVKYIDIDKEGIICKEWENIANNNNYDVTQGLFRCDIKEGNFDVKMINEYYEIEDFKVSEDIYNKINDNILFLRTADTGSEIGVLGLYTLKELFKEKGAVTSSLVTKKTSRLCVPLFFNHKKTIEEQLFIKDEVNRLLREYREKYNSIFLTNFKNATNVIQRKRITFKEVYSLIKHVQS